MVVRDNMVVCETSNTVLLSNELKNVHLMKMLQEYDKPLMACLSDLGVKFISCSNTAWIETLDYTKTILCNFKGSLEQQLTFVLDWVTNPRTKIPSQTERNRQYEEFSKGVKNMIEHMFEIVDGE